MVALRKESVDRNSIRLASFRAFTTSLSARRAWIEISSVSDPLPALKLSLSARRAWIEMIFDEQTEQDSTGRSPQGERG